MTSSATLRQFKLPDVGEGLTEGEILQWLVAVGDTVTVNQPLCEVETAKAAVELPSPYAGTVTELLFEAGTMVDNVPSQRVLLSCGYEQFGLAPKLLFLNGAWRDHVLYQKLLHDRPL